MWKRRGSLLGHHFVGAILAAAACINPAVLRGRHARQLYESETSRLGNIATYYNFTGNVAVKESQQAAAYSAATVREIYVAEGDVVAKGDALARLSDGTLLSAEIAGEVIYGERLGGRGRGRRAVP